MGRKRGRGSFSGDTDSPPSSGVVYYSRTINRQHLDSSSRRLTRQQAKATAAEAARPVTVNESFVQEIETHASSSMHAPNDVVPLSLLERRQTSSKRRETGREKNFFFHYTDGGVEESSKRVRWPQSRAATATTTDTNPSPPLTESLLQVIDAPASSSIHAQNDVMPLSLGERSGDREEAQMEDLVGQSSNPDGNEEGPKTNDQLSSCIGSLPYCQTVIDNFLSSVGSPAVVELVADPLKNATPLTLVGCENVECNEETVEASNCKYIPDETCSYLTEMVKMLGGCDCSEEEVDSLVADSVTVQGYTVKKEYAPTVSAILDKHGDIAEKCFLETVKIRSIFMEQICIIIEKLKEKKFVEIKESEVTKLLCDVEDIDRVNVNIEWLRNRLLKIQEVKTCLSLKQQKDENKKIIGEGKQQIQQLQQSAALITESVRAAEAKNRRISERSKNSAADVQLFMKYSLVHGLV